MFGGAMKVSFIFALLFVCAGCASSPKLRSERVTRIDIQALQSDFCRTIDDRAQIDQVLGCFRRAKRFSNSKRHTHWSYAVDIAGYGRWLYCDCIYVITPLSKDVTPVYALRWEDVQRFKAYLRKAQPNHTVEPTRALPGASGSP
jgi:hypothetical protein